MGAVPTATLVYIEAPAADFETDELSSYSRPSTSPVEGIVYEAEDPTHY